MSLDRFRHRALRVVALVCATSAFFFVRGAQATRWEDMPITCALCGFEYKSSFPVAYSQRGMRLDFQPLGSSPAPWPLAACPQCGFIQFTSDLPEADAAKLRDYVRSSEYKALIETRPTYYRLAKIFEALGKDDLELGHAYLKASWQEERGRETKDKEIRECLEASLKHFRVYLDNGPNDPKETFAEGDGCLSAHQVAQLLKAELLRRFRRFDEARAYLGLLEKLPESQREPAADIIKFQKMLCGYKDSGPHYVQELEIYEQNMEIRSAQAPASELPVRWSGWLELNSLEEVDSILDQRVRQLTLAKDGASGEDAENQKTVETGREWLAALAEGYYARTTFDMSVQSEFIFRVEPPLLLRDHARPSKTSHVKEFEFSGDSIRQLPATIHPACDLEMRTAISQGKVFPGLPEDWEARSKSGELALDSPLWPRFADVFADARAEMDQPRHVRIVEGTEGSGTGISLRLVGWGDFNGDGVEDMLLESAVDYLGGTGVSFGMLLLTRLEPDGPLLELPKPQ